MRLNTLEEAKAEVKKRTVETQYYFAIVLKSTGKVIGEIDAYEAANAFFDYLFNEKGARRIYAYTEDNNLSSQHLCEKLGMRKEGLFKEFISFVNDDAGNPIYENTIQYAILKKEWNQR